MAAQTHRLPPTGIPALQRGNPLARRLIHAVINWQKGFRFDSVLDDYVSRDSRTNRPGRIPLGGGLLYQNTSYGRAIRNSVGGTGFIKWSDANNQYDSSRGITVFACVKPLSIDQPTVAVVYRKAAALTGWEIQTTSAPSPDTWFFSIGNGAVNNSVSSVSGLSLTSTVVIAFRADPERSELSAWVNGVKEANTVTTNVATNNASDVEMFGTFEGFINCVAAWNRPLSNQEMLGLYLDPYKLWRCPAPQQGLLPRLPSWQGSYPSRAVRKTVVIPYGQTPGYGS